MLEETQQLQHKKHKRTVIGTPGKSRGNNAQKRQKNDDEYVEVEGTNKEIVKSPLENDQDYHCFLSLI